MIEYQELTEGMEVVVSDGKPEPDEHMSLPWRQWKSHNFTGTVLAVRETEADIDDGNGTTWTISRTIGHTLTPTDPTDDQMNTFFHAQIDTQAEAARKKLWLGKRVPVQRLYLIFKSWQKPESSL